MELQSLMKNEKGFGKRKSWPTWTYYSSIFLDRNGKTTKKWSPSCCPTNKLITTQTKPPWWCVLTQYKFDPHYEISDSRIRVYSVLIFPADKCVGVTCTLPQPHAVTQMWATTHTCKVLVRKKSHLEDLSTDRGDSTKTDLKETRWEHGLDSSSCG